MGHSLTGSRYELHVTHQGANEQKLHAYYEVLPGDVDETAQAAESANELVGYVHSWEVGSTVDGPGLRFVAFLSGCLLRCQYCHNPDTWHKLNGRQVTVGRAMHEIAKYAEVLKISHGGVTLSGGEPMVQVKFMMEIFRRCKALGLHTCVDTAGRLGARLTDADLLQIDLNLLDIKSGDPAVYQTLTNHPLQPTLDYARRLSDLGRPMWVRFVLAPGLTDGYDNVEKLADICAGLKTVERIEILRFHQMGREKWHRLGIPYPLEHMEPPTPELTERVRGQFRQRGLTVY
jgi:pyruvate formate lyase activating enzyme